MRSLKSLIVLCGIGVAGTSFAGDFYCGSYIIEPGMPSGKVIEYCGEPTERNGDQWRYDRGPEELPVILHIEPDGTIGRVQEQTNL